MSRPHFSIVVPSYNCAAYLPRALESAARFSTLPTEIIVVDDGSTDDTPAVLQHLAPQYPALRALRKPNGGLSSARNHGIAHARGRFLVLLDADDELLPWPGPDELPEAVDMVRIGIEEVAVDGSARLDAEPACEAPAKAWLQQQFERGRFYPPAWAWVYRLDWLRQARLAFAEGLLHEDMLFTVEALVSARRVLVLPQPAYRYFRRPGSITTSVAVANTERRVRSLRRVVAGLTRLAARHPDVDLGWWALFTMDYARSLNRGVRSPKAALGILDMELRFLLRGTGWGRFRTRRQTRYRVRRAADEWLSTLRGAQVN